MYKIILRILWILPLVSVGPGAFCMSLFSDDPEVGQGLQGDGEGRPAQAAQ